MRQVVIRNKATGQLLDRVIAEKQEDLEFYVEQQEYDYKRKNIRITAQYSEYTEHNLLMDLAGRQYL